MLRLRTREPSANRMNSKSEFYRTLFRNFNFGSARATTTDNGSTASNFSVLVVVPPQKYVIEDFILHSSQSVREDDEILIRLRVLVAVKYSYPVEGNLFFDNGLQMIKNNKFVGLHVERKK